MPSEAGRYPRSSAALAHESARVPAHTNDHTGRSCRRCEREKIARRRPVLAVRTGELGAWRDRGIPDRDRGIALVARQRPHGDASAASRTPELLMYRSRTRITFDAAKIKVSKFATRCHL
jgi:hypothetical protein